MTVTLTYIIVTTPSHGNIYNDAGGGNPDGDALAAGDELTSHFTIYNPNANYNGTDTFTFKANDGEYDSNISTVTISVNPVNDAPVSLDTSIATRENVPVAVTFSASDVDGDNLSYSILTQPTGGV